MREARGLAHDDADAGAAVAPRGELLDPAVVERDPRRAAILHEHLGELTAPGERGGERPLDGGRIDEGGLGLGHGCSLLVLGGRSAGAGRTSDRSTVPRIGACSLGVVVS